jgi:hypothetical protein
MTRISIGKPFDYDAIRKSEFGVILSNLLDFDGLDRILKTFPNGLKLSDWRNIAYHHTYRIEEDMIICTYGKAKTTLTLSKGEFEQCLHQIIRSCNIINIARCIFSFDNLNAFMASRAEISLPNIAFRKPMLIEQLRISFMSQGFKLNEYQEAEVSIVAHLWDLTNDGTIGASQLQMRTIHSSQLLYNIWCVFKKEIVKVIYCTKDGAQIVEYTVAGNICDKIHKGEPLSYMVKHVAVNSLLDEPL